MNWEHNFKYTLLVIFLDMTRSLNNNERVIKPEEINDCFKEYRKLQNEGEIYYRESDCIMVQWYFKLKLGF